MIVAKPVIKDKFWILQEDDHKIGNIEAISDGYSIRINDSITKVKSISSIRKNSEFAFEAPPVFKKSAQLDCVHGYSTEVRVHNGMWDVRNKLPLFTKTKKSKSWYAAGWFLLKQKKNWEVVRNPKLISLQRYPYKGPFKTKEEVTL
jgi:hypothetical protein